MKAAVLYGQDDIRVEDIAIPQPQAHEILVKVMATGICGSDVPRVLGTKAHHYPIVLGHEFAGIVAKVGTGVTRIGVGDRIAGAPLVPCHQCVDCFKGDFAQCQYYSFVGSRVNGSWAEYVIIPEINAVRIDDTVSYAEAAFFEPSAVALHALRHISFQGGEDVAILGGGTIGLLTLQWAKVLGARTVTVFDINHDRLELARKLGADYVIDTRSEDFKEQATSIVGAKGFGIVMETAGSDVTMRLSFELAANKAKVCFVGTPTKELTFDYKLFELMNRKEFTLTGSWMSYSAPFPGNEWELTAHFLSKQRFNFLDMIDKILPLEQINDAFELYKQPGAVKGKILLTLGSEPV
ncbi:galactitol-1-phosphate 5-dehydrogenase [Paenibacillus sp. FSL H7-0331]|uniref:galactitol-1-phosphate 5-dehydrogenase n=1 Tax=Paenibacillus sp. FSL H7-0331 TaxID=1920421 RepID=UPI00096D2789|nr:galactitol-1-phosphate 5-dehydrogenase [Paenibacillus sp. FSL H7-0331]OMF20821.1 galactitol-1-phosphate 5-dehydrogenase [Paenibacillus sp. FSL H7-0331]